MDLKHVGYDGVDWINLAYDRGQWRRLSTTQKTFLSSIKGGEILYQLSDYNNT
jgi:hypothetical protein